MIEVIGNLLKKVKKTEILMIILSIMLFSIGVILKTILLYVYYSLLIMLFLISIRAIKKNVQKSVVIFTVIFLAILFTIASVNALPTYWTLPILLTSSSILVFISTLTKNPILSIVSLLLFGTILIFTFITIGGSSTIEEAMFAPVPSLPLIY